jgi:hypothetical protein
MVEEGPIIQKRLSSRSLSFSNISAASTASLGGCSAVLCTCEERPYTCYGGTRPLPG